LDRGAKADLDPRNKALAGLASLLSESPWLLEPSDLDRARRAGLSDAELRHAVVLSAFFNYLNRVADAIDLELDYESPLPRMTRDPARAPFERGSRSRATPAFAELSIRELPRTEEALRRWSDYVLRRAEPLAVSERTTLARAAAGALGDEATSIELGPEGDLSPRGRLMAELSRKLTLSPWSWVKDDLERLRGLGFDDRALLDIVSVIAFQNTASRIRIAISTE
jgi:alkylhydroperoxidase family enzyme